MTTVVMSLEPVCVLGAALSPWSDPTGILVLARPKDQALMQALGEPDAGGDTELREQCPRWGAPSWGSMGCGAWLWRWGRAGAAAGSHGRAGLLFQD